MTAVVAPEEAEVLKKSLWNLEVAKEVEEGADMRPVAVEGGCEAASNHLIKLKQEKCLSHSKGVS